MYGPSVARSGSTTRVPVNAGTGSSSKGTFSRLARASSTGSSGSRSFSECWSRSRSCRRFSLSSGVYSGSIVVM